ncbi:MAG: hypothetical protein ABRQ27_01135 [Clostridiaceae bacterium]
MKKIFSFMLILCISFSLSGCINKKTETPPNNDSQQTNNSGTEGTEQSDESDKSTVKSLVESFGKKLQMVSLLAPADTVSKSLEENYGDFVSADLLGKWKNDPSNAPGRMLSSPWPDRIEVESVEKISDGLYEVKGQIIEITSVEQEKGGAAAKRSITLKVKKVDDKWLIDAVTLGEYTSSNSVIYRNSQYGFNFTLPSSWSGYTIVDGKWEGLEVGNGDNIIETGPIINIRHPKWTTANPRQDIPIMVFTIAQWNSMQQDKFHIGAAPINPSELGRNSKYVFALPARYNYAFPTGFEEVEEILKNKPLTT